MKDYLPRLLAKECKRAAREYPVLAILGPRQSGKTTLAQKAFPRKKYVSLEDLDYRTFATQDPRGFLETYSTGAIIDETQLVPQLLSYIQTKVDRERKKGQFILTGSNQFLLEEKLAQSLAGRVSLLRLLPLSWRELSSLRGQKWQLADLLYKGFYPQLHVEKVRSAKWFSNYIETYIQKDVRLVKNIGDLGQFSLFVKMLAARAGQLLNLQSLSNDCGISQNTVKSWLSVLQSGFIVKLLRPYHRNFNKRLVKTPKIFFYDTGVLCHLLSITSARDIETHALRGALFENFVFTELEKHFFNRAENPPLSFWRDRKGQEIDFLIDGPKFKMVEAKSAQTATQEFFKNIDSFKTIATGQSYLIYAGKERQRRAGTTVLPWTEMGKIF